MSIACVIATCTWPVTCRQVLHLSAGWGFRGFEVPRLNHDVGSCQALLGLHLTGRGGDAHLAHFKPAGKAVFYTLHGLQAVDGGDGASGDSGELVVVALVALGVHLTRDEDQNSVIQ